MKGFFLKGLIDVKEDGKQTVGDTQAVKAGCVQDHMEKSRLI